MQKFASVLAILILGHCGPILGGKKVPCDLKWVPLGPLEDFEIPDNSIIAGENEYVARHITSGTPGRFSVLHQQLLSVETSPDHTSTLNAVRFERQDVEILVNEEDCEVAWLPREEVLNPGLPTDLNPFTMAGASNHIIGIGRVETGDTTEAGWFTMEDGHMSANGGALFVHDVSGEAKYLQNFHVLTSSSPLMFGTLKKIRLQLANLANANTHKELFGFQEIKHGSSNSVIRQNIQRSYQFSEEYVFTEPLKDFGGLSALTIEMKGPTTSEPFSDILDARDPNVKDLKLLRDVRHSVTKELEITNSSHLQVCSLAEIAEGVELPFEGVLEIDAEDNGMTVDHVRHVIERSGRKLIGVEGHVVKASFQGIVRATFFVQSAIHVENYMGPGSGCLQALQ